MKIARLDDSDADPIEPRSAETEDMVRYWVRISLVCLDGARRHGATDEGLMLLSERYLPALRLITSQEAQVDRVLTHYDMAAEATFDYIYRSDLNVM